MDEGKDNAFMKEFEIIIDITSAITHFLFLVAGIYLILTTGPELLFYDPTYTLLVIIFGYLVTTIARGHRD
jgi:hypothetical protein